VNTPHSTINRLERRVLFPVRLLYLLICILAHSSTASAQDSDGQLLAAVGVTEPIAIPTMATSTGAAVNVFDFRVLDGATIDGLATNVMQVVLHTSGTAPSTAFSNIVWRLNGTGVSNVTGTYSSGSNTITFSGLSMSVSNGGLETYTVNAYYGTNTGLTEGQTFIFSIDGDVDLTLGAGTLMSGANGTISNSTGSTVDITATKLTSLRSRLVRSVAAR
jgi:hypothetical protein